MNKQQLASKIWAGANALRGKVSADAYKDYMLGFVFYKYLSYKEEKYLKESLYFTDDEIVKLDETDEETVDNCKKHIGYFISGKNLFSYWVLNKRDFQIKDVRIALNTFDNNISQNYKKVYTKIFDTLNKGLDSLGTGDPERTKAAREIIDLIVEIPTDGSQEYDVLGFIYEFLLKNFAANAGKAGEFYTPHEASLLMSEIVAEHLKDKSEISIYDPTSGSGSLLINIGQTIAKHMNQRNKIKYFAQELIENTYNLTRMNLLMRDILPSNIIVRNNDTLKDDWPFFEDNNREATYELIQVDAAISNPPYSQAWDTVSADTDPRFADYGIAPKSKADYAFLLHSLYHLKDDGIMTIVLPHGVLFRGGDEKKIRQRLIDKDNIDTIIGLPSNMFFGTGIPTIIMVLKKNRNNNDVLIIDASKGFCKDGNKNKLRDKDIKKILDVIKERKTIERFSKVVSKQDIIDNDYNLNIPKYVDSSKEADYCDIYGSMYGKIPNYEIEKFSKYWDVFKSLKDEAFTKIDDIPYSVITTDDLKLKINNNEDVKKYIEDFRNNFVDFKDYLKKELIDNNQTLNIYKEKEVITEELRNRFKNLKLVDFYDLYQIFVDNWNSILLDLEILQNDGLEALNIVEPNMVYKKNKQKELEEKQEGWLGKVLSFDLIQDVYFTSEKDELDLLSSKLKQCEDKKNELLDSIDVNDKANLLKDDSEDIDTKKLNAAISKINKELRAGAEFEEETYEYIIIEIDKVNKEIKAAKKRIKELKTDLEVNSKETIEGIKTEEALKLLEEKWITPLCNQINNIPINVVREFNKKLIQLKEKYEIGLNELEADINESEKALVSILKELNGNEYDVKGLDRFIAMLGGEKVSKKNNPSIRFSKFAEEWEEKELDKIVNYTASNLTVKDALDEGRYNVYDANNIIGKTDCEPMKEEYISIIKDGAGVGRIRRLPKKSCFIGTMGALTSNGSDIDFIYALLSKYNLGSQFSGSTIPHIYFKDYGKNNYFVPGINEQKQIGECFKKIDNLLELYYSKKDNLIKLKKTLLEKMFPTSNNTVPKIRFKKYNDDWKTKTYNDLGTPLSGGSLSYDSLNESGNKKCILYGDLYTKYDCVIKNIKNRTFDNGNTVIKNDILFPQSTTVDAYSLVSPACMNEDSAETSGVFVIRPISDINGNFVCYYTKGNEEQRNKIAKNGQGLTIVHLYYRSIKDDEIKIPTKSEQDDISNLFVEIDKLIELYSNKIDRFQDFKNSMLNLLII